MPLYDFRCTKCGETQEVLLKVTQRDQEGTCHCGGTLKRLPSLPARAKFAVPGVKGHYTTNADGSGTRC